jgi:hypothetical protein
MLGTDIYIYMRLLSCDLPGKQTARNHEHRRNSHHRCAVSVTDKLWARCSGPNLAAAVLAWQAALHEAVGTEWKLALLILFWPVAVPRYSGLINGLEVNSTTQATRSCRHIELTLQVYCLILHEDELQTCSMSCTSCLTCVGVLLVCCVGKKTQHFLIIILMAFFGNLIFPAALSPGVHSVSNRNEHQKHNNNVSGE